MMMMVLATTPTATVVARLVTPVTSLVRGLVSRVIAGLLGVPGNGIEKWSILPFIIERLLPTLLGVMIAKRPTSVI